MRVARYMFLIAPLWSSLAASEVSLSALPFAESSIYQQGTVQGSPPTETIVMRYYLKNIGSKTLRVPTAGFFESVTTSPQRYEIVLKWDFLSAPEGSRLIPSEAALHVVSLNPGEVAVVEWKVSGIGSPSSKRLSVGLNIAKDFAVRFGVWEGTLEPKEALKSGDLPKKIADPDWRRP